MDIKKLRIDSLPNEPGVYIFKGKNEVSASLNSKFKSFNFDLNWENTFDNYPPLSIPFSTQYQLISNTICFPSQIGIKTNLLIFFQIKV